MASTSLMSLGGANANRTGVSAGYKVNPLGGPIPGYAASSQNTPYTPARSSSIAGFDLNSLLNRLSGVRGFQDVNLPDAPTPTRTQVQMPRRGAYGSVDKSTLNRLTADMGATRGEFFAPTQSGAFQNLMNLASMQTARARDEEARTALEATARRGFTGGYSAQTERAGRDRMRALAESGAIAAKDIRETAGALYGQQTGAVAGLAGELERSAAERATAYAKDVAEARRQQAQLDFGYGGQLIDLYGARNQALLGQGELRERGRATDIGALTDLARLSLSNYEGQNEMALLERRAQLEEQAARSAEERRRAAKEYDFQFGEKHAPAARKRTFEDAMASDPHLQYLARTAGNNPLARMALERARRNFKF